MVNFWLNFLEANNIKETKEKMKVICEISPSNSSSESDDKSAFEYHHEKDLKF